jgi:ParB-like chromosome segregation protein Spo0J
MEAIDLFARQESEYLAFIEDQQVKILHMLDDLSLANKIEAINRIKQMLHAASPFASEPVDCVIWVPAEIVGANDYNPNSVAPPEMKLLEHSITEDGYTQPIVAWRNGDAYEVVDGFHRNRVGKESATVRKRVHGYLPITKVNDERLDKSDRIAATIRHNRARGKHKVEAMSDIVIELKRRNWSDEKIGKELGMDPDEVLRLCQITGLAEVFADQDFSKAWDIEAMPERLAGEILSDLDAAMEAEDSGRIFHTWDKWECFRAGFYEEKPEGMTQEEGEEKYREFLADLPRFEAALQVVIGEWKHSCEHYLTNDRMNRIAWLGQAALAQARSIPSCCRGGYKRLTPEQQAAADALALEYLNHWLAANDREPVAMAEALGRTEAELY